MFKSHEEQFRNIPIFRELMEDFKGWQLPMTALFGLCVFAPIVIRSFSRAHTETWLQIGVSIYIVAAILFYGIGLRRRFLQRRIAVVVAYIFFLLLAMAMLYFDVFQWDVVMSAKTK